MIQPIPAPSILILRDFRKIDEPPVLVATGRAGRDLCEFTCARQFNQFPELHKTMQLLAVADNSFNPGRLTWRRVGMQSSLDRSCLYNSASRSQERGFCPRLKKWKPSALQKRC
jgi:hypothetical protein